MFQINHAINMIYNYEGYIWTWSHRKDAFVMNTETTGSLLTRRPVRKVDKFRTSRYTDVDKIKEDPCVCPVNPPSDLVRPCCDCNCTAPCDPFLLDQILPQNQLCAGQFQISGGFVPGM